MELITKRPENMLFEEYKVRKKVQNKDIKNYLKYGILVTKMYPSNKGTFKKDRFSNNRNSFKLTVLKQTKFKRVVQFVEDKASGKIKQVYHYLEV